MIMMQPHYVNVDNIYKLITHEDKYHIHKTLGILSLMTYFYRLRDIILPREVLS